MYNFINKNNNYIKRKKNDDGRIRALERGTKE